MTYHLPTEATVFGRRLAFLFRGEMGAEDGGGGAEDGWTGARASSGDIVLFREGGEGRKRGEQKSRRAREGERITFTYPDWAYTDVNIYHNAQSKYIVEYDDVYVA